MQRKLRIMGKENGSRNQLRILVGIPKSKKGRNRKKQSCVTFRSAGAAAASAPFSSESTNSKNLIHLNKAKTVLAISKIMGDDDEVLSKIMRMEAEDEERYNNQAPRHGD